MKVNSHKLAAIVFSGLATLGGLPPVAAQTTPTTISVTNPQSQAVYVNLVLGQPPAVLPPNCTNLGSLIIQVDDPRLIFKSSLGKNVVFTPQAQDINDKGYYSLSPGEVITYQAQPCSKGGPTSCSPAMAFNVFFTSFAYGGSPNNGCGGSSQFPNGTNLAETSINFAINGSQGSGCANADDADISAVNGINSAIELQITGPGWPLSSALNSTFAKNADLPGVFGWAATTCTGNAGYPNPGPDCLAPVEAPRAQNGACRTPKGQCYAPIVDPLTKVEYCDERSDTATCNNQRSAGITGGTIAIAFNGFLD